MPGVTVDGLFPRSAGLFSDIVVLVELGIAASLVAGMFVVRTGRIRAHMYLQSSMVLVNVPIVLAWMVPQFLTNVVPDLGGELLEPYYLLPFVALVVGAAAEALGVYILLVAGTSWIPARWRFRRYKLWMRTELGLWWAVVILGLAIYYVWYAGPPAGS